jgi:hypothetical protein
LSLHKKFVVPSVLFDYFYCRKIFNIIHNDIIMQKFQNMKFHKKKFLLQLNYLLFCYYFQYVKGYYYDDFYCVRIYINYYYYLVFDKLMNLNPISYYNLIIIPLTKILYQHLQVMLISTEFCPFDFDPRAEIFAENTSMIQYLIWLLSCSFFYPIRW